MAKMERQALKRLIEGMERPCLMLSEPAPGCHCGGMERPCSSCQYAYLWDDPNRDSPHLVGPVSTPEDIPRELWARVLEWHYR